MNANIPSEREVFKSTIAMHHSDYVYVYRKQTVVAMIKIDGES